jgi:TRAP-type C4-dicarboxylate transport system substrate-binding protein
LTLNLKRSSRLKVVGLAVYLSLATACGSGGGTQAEGDGAEADESFVLRAAAPTATGSSFQRVSEYFFNEVEKRSDGRLTIEPNFNSSLVGAGEALQALQDGRVDLIYWGGSYSPGSTPLFEVTGVPFVSQSEHGVVWTLTDMYQDGGLLKEEFDAMGIRPLFFHFNGSGQIFSPEKMDGPSDLADKRFRVTGLAGKAIEAVGGAPVGTEPAEIYESLQRGVLNGTMFGFESGAGFGTAEVAPNIHEIGTGIYFEAGEFISEDAWNELPEDLQQIMLDVAKEVNDKIGPEILAETSAADCEAFRAAEGSSYTVFDPDEVDEWREQSQDAIKGEWAKKAADAKGVSVDEINAWFDEYTALVEKNAAEAEEQGFTPNWQACAETFE